MVKKSKKTKISILINLLKSQNIGYLINDKPIDLVAVFQPMAGFHLTETPVANDQELTQTKRWIFTS